MRTLTLTLFAITCLFVVSSTTTFASDSTGTLKFEATYICPDGTIVPIGGGEVDVDCPPEEDETVVIEETKTKTKTKTVSKTVTTKPPKPVAPAPKPTVKAAAKGWRAEFHGEALDEVRVTDGNIVSYFTRGGDTLKPIGEPDVDVSTEGSKIRAEYKTR